MPGRAYLDMVSLGPITVYNVAASPDGVLDALRGSFALRSDTGQAWLNTSSTASGTAWSMASWNGGPFDPAIPPLLPVGSIQPNVAAALGGSTLVGAGLLGGFAQVQDALAVSASTQGVSISQSTSAVLNNSAYIHMPTVSTLFSFGLARMLYADTFFLSGSLADLRLFSGFASDITGAPVGADDPAFGHFALQFSTARGDVNFQIARKNAGAQSLTNTLVAPALSRIYRFEVLGIANNQARARLWDLGTTAGPGAAALVFDQAFTVLAEVPSSGTAFSGISNLAAAVKTVGRLRTTILSRNGSLS